MARHDEDQVKLEEKFFNKLGISVAAIPDAKKVIALNKDTGAVVCLVGEAGIGKTHLVRQVAQERKPTKPFFWKGREWKDSVPMVPWYLAHMQAEDMGVPYPSRAKRNELLNECALYAKVAGSLDDASLAKKAKQHSANLAKVVLETGSPLEDGTFEFLIEKNLKDLPPEGILFLDEWNRADKTVVKSFFTLLEDREVHGVPVIPPGVQIVAAMNPSDGAYSVNEAEKDHAFRRRMSFLAVTCNVSAWLRYAEGPGKFHQMVTSYIKASPDELYDTKLRNAGKAFPCPATWEKVSNILFSCERAALELDNAGASLCIDGFVGTATGSKFMRYVKDNNTIISPTEVIEKYSPQSKVRKRVLKMVEQNRNDVIAELCDAVAITLFASQPPAKRVGENLARFMNDLPPELKMTFIQGKLGKASQEAENSGPYLLELSQALCAYEQHHQNIQQITSITDKAEAEMRGESAVEE